MEKGAGGGGCLWIILFIIAFILVIGGTQGSGNVDSRNRAVAHGVYERVYGK